MIWNKKKREDALKRITATAIIVNDSVREPECFYTAIDNLTEIAFDVGGIKGMKKIQNTLDKYWGQGGQKEGVTDD